MAPASLSSSKAEVKVTDRRRILATAALVLVCLAVTLTVTQTALLYRSALSEKRSDLRALAQREAQVIEATFEHNSLGHSPAEHVQTASVMSCLTCSSKIVLIAQVLRHGGNLRSGTGEGIEFVIGYREGDAIHFLLPRQHALHEDTNEPMDVPWESERAEPMRLALTGQSGTIEAKDYRGETVLAAFAPVKLVGWGVVAKIDMADMRLPFVAAVRSSLVFAALAILAGLIMLRRRLRPLIQLSQASEEQALAALQTQKFALDQHSIVGITDRFGKITYANDKFCRISQYSRDELIGQDHRIVSSGHHPRTFWAEAWKTVADGNVWQAEVCNQAKDGSLYWVDTTIVPIKDEAGSIEQYIAIRTDITDRKQHEEVLGKAKVAAEAANRAKSEFLANMSHEIRTPLHGILSFARFGTDRAMTADPERLRDYFENIEASGERLMVLLSDILDLAKMESAAMRYEFKPADFRLVVRSVQNDFQSLLAARDITVEYTEPESEMRLTLDASRMGQVVRNLLSNAAKFSPDGGAIKIEVSQDSEVLRLSIRDQGMGIPEDELETVFDKFVQSSKTRTGAGGTGLGLSICREIVDAHTGRIWCENHTEGGAVFHMTLPKTMTTAPLEGDQESSSAVTRDQDSEQARVVATS